ncbi:alpha-hydroxy acid oxidase [Paraburkholderia fungorum]|uniref:alpha-hydroxy acid oxidase n=2 Tax=Paraburkholderia fungorum TaxID=134537 RepID=UPI00402B9444
MMKRKLYAGRDFRLARNIEELRMVARRWLPNFVLEYMDSGAEDEITLRSNREAFDAWRFVPSALVDTSSRDASVQWFGRHAALPLVIAPTGYNGMLRQGADVALARAAAQADIPFTLSTVANQTLEEVVSEAGARTWLQLYILRDQAVTLDLVERARNVGCEALVLTVDAVHYGNREWDRRCYRKGMELNWPNKFDVAMHPRWLWNVLMPRGVPSFANIARYLPVDERRAANGAVYIARQMETRLDWNSVRWLRDIWKGKLIVKGIMNVSDSRKAQHIGVDGIVVTNHGGRQLDGTVASLDALPAIVDACADKLTIFVDGGFRRGTDVVKALCLGAHGVMVGRPTLYGVAAGGADGAAHALSILSAEIDRTLAQLGCNSARQLSRRYLMSLHGSNFKGTRAAYADESMKEVIESL